MPSEAHLREQDRLAALDRYDILDTPEEERFDRITRLICRIFQVPIATVTLLDAHRQWFKSRQGLSVCETSRRPAFCSVAIQEEFPLIVADTLTDERFSTNPLVLGEPHIRFYAGVPLRSPDGHPIGTLCAMDTEPRTFEAEQIEMLSDLSRIVMSEFELRLLATTDSLTGALSRRAFKQEGSRVLALAVRHRFDLSCIVFDLDYFKSVNDTHGHAAGDRVLVEAIGACRSALRESDLIGRLGGEEFAVLLPHTGRAAAMEVAEKLRAAIAGQPVSGPSGLDNVSASFGIATLDRSARDLEAMLQNADAALYRAKAEGRNRCVEWRPPEALQPNLRRRVLKAGQISFNAGRSTIDCTVRTLSETGAGLDVVSSAGVPETFKLRIDADDLSRVCRMTDKRDKHIEVAFD